MSYKAIVKQGNGTYQLNGSLELKAKDSVFVTLHEHLKGRQDYEVTPFFFGPDCTETNFKNFVALAQDMAKREAWAQAKGESFGGEVWVVYKTEIGDTWCTWSSKKDSLVFYPDTAPYQEPKGQSLVMSEAEVRNLMMAFAEGQVDVYCQLDDDTCMVNLLVCEEDEYGNDLPADTWRYQQQWNISNELVRLIEATGKQVPLYDRSKSDEYHMPIVDLTTPVNRDRGEVPIHWGHQFKGLVIESSDAQSRLTVEAPLGGWTLADLAKIDVLIPGMEHGYEIYLGKEWIGSSEI